MMSWARFRKAGMIVRYKFTIRTHRSRFGCSPISRATSTWRVDMEPDIVMSMVADTAPEFWLGQVNVTIAMARGQIKAKARWRRSSSWCR